MVREGLNRYMLINYLTMLVCEYNVSTVIYCRRNLKVDKFYSYQLCHLLTLNGTSSIKYGPIANEGTKNRYIGPRKNWSVACSSNKISICIFSLFVLGTRGERVGLTRRKQGQASMGQMFLSCVISWFNWLRMYVPGSNLFYRLPGAIWRVYFLQGLTQGGQTLLCWR